ncbi:hypothetical protein NP233_g12364 [Leucocoprinus birnbaumii]|uniref:Nephrocystin 3-like N-terminal domain-containing protein n=1 Tax=Leucocoprinus birnbaumii TaxID=56174 RepID=A0AAD5VEJ6_9AGAR|nr:hypothetical protein NP233_g12364 [Leucocoprinus birnbaumii]
MSVLHEAHDFAISNSSFQSTQINFHSHGKNGIDILLEVSTPEAAVDAQEREYAPSCYPGTREQYINDITSWAAFSDSYALPLYWVKGPAGVGKSALAQTCATKLMASGHLGAAFFFSLNGRCKDHTRFFPTLSYQLSTVLPDYRDVVNQEVLIDKTLVKKTMASQFHSLIATPLQRLGGQGKEFQGKAILIDGLDECESREAQVEIIQIIADSIQRGLTPFRWAIFSREDPHITSTFSAAYIAPLCCTVFLPISRQIDEEIELYLRSGFENMLRRRNLLSLLTSWPAPQEIRKLVDAAAGLFAHAATVIRFIDRHSFSGFQEALSDVIASFAAINTQNSSPYDELDRLYSMLLQRVPEDVYPSMNLLFSYMVRDDFDGESWLVAVMCNSLGISEAFFRSIYQNLQAVMVYQEPPNTLLDAETLDLVRSHKDQGSSFKENTAIEARLLRTHGTINFYHKSFYDFIINPNRSSTFCVISPDMHESLFNRLVARQFDYASNYVVREHRLIIAPGASNHSPALSWAHEDESINYFLQLRSFYNVSHNLSHVDLGFDRFLQDVPPSSL